jgi:hypothetical protein
MSELHDGSKYVFEREGGERTTEEMVQFWSDLADKFPIVSIEDGFDEDDWEGHKALTDKIGKRVQLVGDDLFVTNTERLKRGIDMGAGNSILIKVNQIGTLTETLAAIEMAKRAGFTAVLATVPAKPKTPPSLILPLRRTPDKLRPAHRPAPTASPSTINCCASKKSWAMPHCSQDAMRSTT